MHTQLQQNQWMNTTNFEEYYFCDLKPFGLANSLVTLFVCNKYYLKRFKLVSDSIYLMNHSETISIIYQSVSQFRKIFVL